LKNKFQKKKKKDKGNVDLTKPPIKEFKEMNPDL